MLYTVHDVPVKLCKYSTIDSTSEFFIMYINENISTYRARIQFMVKMDYYYKSDLMINPVGDIPIPQVWDSTASEWVDETDPDELIYIPPSLDSTSAIDTTAEIIYGTSLIKEHKRLLLDEEKGSCSMIIDYVNKPYDIGNFPCRAFWQPMYLSYFQGLSTLLWHSTFIILADLLTQSDRRAYDAILRKVR